MPGAGGAARSSNPCRGWLLGAAGSLPSFSGQVSFPHCGNKPSSEAGTNWPPCWQSQQRCQSEWAWNPTQTLRGFLLRSRLRCFGRQVWGKLTLLLSVSRSVKLPPFLSTGTQGFGLLRCVLLLCSTLCFWKCCPLGGLSMPMNKGNF